VPRTADLVRDGHTTGSSRKMHMRILRFLLPPDMDVASCRSARSALVWPWFTPPNSALRMPLYQAGMQARCASHGCGAEDPWAGVDIMLTDPIGSGPRVGGQTHRVSRAHSISRAHGL
jgi:hypothetical protein